MLDALLARFMLHRIGATRAGLISEVVGTFIGDLVNVNTFRDDPAGALNGPLLGYRG